MGQSTVLMTLSEVESCTSSLETDEEERHVAFLKLVHESLSLGSAGGSVEVEIFEQYSLHHCCLHARNSEFSFYFGNTLE